MHALEVLLQLAQRQTDTERTLLAEAARASGSVAEAVAAKATAIASEQAASAHVPEGWRDWPGWAARATLEHRALGEGLRLARQAEEARREALREALGAARRLELVLAEREREQRRMAQRRAEAKAEETELHRFRAARNSDANVNIPSRR